jgi:hypothetical protein
MTTPFYKEYLILRDMEQHHHIHCDHLYCCQIATTSRWGWRGKELVLKGQWCRNHDKWWKRIELPEILKDERKGVRNHLFTFLSLAGMVTLAIKNLPVFLITLVAAGLGIILWLIYELLWDFFDHLW